MFFTRIRDYTIGDRIISVRKSQSYMVVCPVVYIPNNIFHYVATWFIFS